MALPTFLELVNNVLTRLREQTVSSVNDTEYSRLIKVMINDSKREIENANDWSALRTSVSITTSLGTENYTLSDLGVDFKVKDVYNLTSKVPLRETVDKYINDNNYLSSSVNGVPYYYVFKGIDSVSGDAKVRLFPVPDGVYTIQFEVCKRQSDLVNDSDRVLIPGHLIELLTLAKAIAERGEDGGQMSNQVYQQFLVNLSDSIAIEKGRFSAETMWEVT